MNNFDVVQTIFGFNVLTDLQHECEHLRQTSGGGTPVPNELKNNVRAFMETLRDSCAQLGFEKAYRTVAYAAMPWNASLDVSMLKSTLDTIRTEVTEELWERKFLHVRTDRVKYLDRDDLFGDAVSIAFPSASRDIREAGNCLAAENTTACVFHLMRAVEVALRIVAQDREVKFPNEPLESKQWGAIITQLEVNVKTLRAYDRALWPSGEVRDAQISFYNQAMVEFGYFNEAFRINVSHARRGAFYDRHQAFSIMDHSQKFMRQLAEKISERSHTPKIWDTL